MKYTVSYLLPKVKLRFSMKATLDDVEERRVQFENHIKEYCEKGYELASTSNMAYGVWFFWKKQ